MIKSTDKHVAIAGNPIEIMQDFVNITKAVHGLFKEKMGEQSSNDIVALCGRIAFVEDQTEEEMYLERLAEILARREIDDLS